MFFRQIFDDQLAQNAYLIGCQQTGEALIVDPQRDIDRYLSLAAQEGLRINAVTETHIHADFLSGARELAEHDQEIKVYLSDEGDEDWKYLWVPEGRPQVRFLKHGDTFSVGKIELRVLHTPGHTPEHLSFLVTDRGGGASEPMGILSGDFVFVGDLGRPDLLESAAGLEGAMEPSAQRLYASAREFLKLPDYLQVWPGHGAGSACGKALGAVPESTVGYERRFSPAIAAAQGPEADFVRFILDGQPEPPLYFGRMKILNKEGAPVLGDLPRPREMDATELLELAGGQEATILDTRLDREAYLAGHIEGSVYAPLNRTFPTIAGSYVDPDLPIFLIVETHQVEGAVRSLVRVGLDQVVGFATAETLQQVEGLTPMRSVDFAELRRLPAEPKAAMLDVRSMAEFEEGHLPEAIHIPHTRLRARLGEIPKDTEILVHCRSGARASSAVSLLERQGFSVTLVNDLFTNRPKGESEIAV